MMKMAKKLSDALCADDLSTGDNAVDKWFDLYWEKITLIQPVSVCENGQVTVQN